MLFCKPYIWDLKYTLDNHFILKIFIPATSVKEGLGNIEVSLLTVLIVRLEEEIFKKSRGYVFFQR